jgi:hypothetical protein
MRDDVLPPEDALTTLARKMYETMAARMVGLFECGWDNESESLREDWRAVAAVALSRSAAQPELAGWKIVPIEPTRAMLDGAVKATYLQDNPYLEMKRRWNGFLEAAPLAPGAAQPEPVARFNVARPIKGGGAFMTGWRWERDDYFESLPNGEHFLYGRAPIEAPAPSKPSTLDPNESDPLVLWAEIARLQAAVKGPDGYASWQDAATAERLRRVEAERRLTEPQPAQPDDQPTKGTAPDRARRRREAIGMAVETAIQFGFHDTNKPPPEHWLLPHWFFGRELAFRAPPSGEKSRASLLAELYRIANECTPPEEGATTWHFDHGQMAQFVEAVATAITEGSTTSKATARPDETTGVRIEAPARQPEPMCACKDRLLSKCPGEWEPGCDLGANEKHAQVAP